MVPPPCPAPVAPAIDPADAGIVAERLLTARTRLLKLPDVRQHTVYACGAAALQAVLAYYDIDVRGDELMVELGTDSVVGTRWWEIVRVAGMHGLSAEVLLGMDEAELAALLDGRVPVLLAIQAWGAPLPPPADGVAAAERTEDGHYVVAVGHDAERFYFEDPAIFGIGYVPRAELGSRWYDFDEHRRRLDRFGIAFRPRRRPASGDGPERIM
jgi:predicted double-glycine peptidase